MERRRSPLSAWSAALALLVPAACGVPAAQGACISWVPAADDAARTELADVVVEGRPLDKVGERAMFGVTATVWRVEVDRVLKGTAEPGTTIDVAATPRSCEAGGAYPDGDPLDAAGRLRLYLSDSDFGIEGTEAGLALITPFDGVGAAER
ncbi:hypothetical protein M3148_02625 [Georgenia satyanarayanai]|uniref:hypothetical protein n=1 Tax=Georgenia satyanarayanai TaxID=860221 RepID=UPI002040E200|nr:hypothetical protein [Georgenia satyanarayanai]MCM3659896.1 hypothetical protein [Georgenia satyanarayanai]